MTELSEEAVRVYLDAAIRTWRTKRREAQTRAAKTPGERETHRQAAAMASHYVDAFQSMRVTFLGAKLPQEE